MIEPASHPHVVVLAGGEGTRLASLTRALYGVDLPKQFAVLSGEKSLLQQTIERALLITTAERISVVVTGHREAIARDQLAPYPGVELVVQPRNLDTGPGLLLPLVRVLSRDANARIIFMPSDHYVANDAPLVAALRASEHGALHDRVVLAGVAPTGPEVEYGWIVRGASLARTQCYAVASFSEKPDPNHAETLWRTGALWNTFILAGSVDVLWKLARRYLPRHAELFARHAASPGDVTLADTYRVMPSANFSCEVLANANNLAVVPVADSGWSDWGSPKRVFASLVGTPNHDRLVERIRGDAAVALAS